MPFSNAIIPAPTAAKRPQTTKQLGRARTDDYAWLKDDNWQAVMNEPSALDPIIRAHLEAENAYTAAVLADTNALQQTLLSEFKGRIKDDDSTVPSPDGDFAYSHRYRPGDQHGLYVRTPRAGGAETVILDADAMAAKAKEGGHGFFDLGSTGHSDNHESFAYAVDLQGAERYQIIIRDIKTQKIIGAPIDNSAGDFVWAADNQTIFWVERDDNNRPSKVMRRNMFAANAKSVLVYEEADPGFFVSLSRSDTENFIEIGSNDHTTSETWLIPSDKPAQKPVLVDPRKQGREYSLHDHDQDFYILTNQDGAVDFKIMTTRQDQHEAANWRDFIPHKPGTLILGLETYQGFMVRLERVNALPQIIIRDLTSGEEHAIKFDEPAYSLGLVGGYEYGTPWLRISYSSPTTQGQVFDYHMGTRERVLRKTAEIPSGHNPADYEARRITVKSRDGEDIPVTLLMRADFAKDGTAPCLLYGYGSYGITIPAAFRTNILSLIDRGFVYAIAHIRGGMAKGYEWYTKGKLKTKQATFDDFIDVGQALCDQNYTARGNIISHGGSAGGLLVGAALNQDPDLFGGVIAAVPFVDVLNTMSDESLPLTPPEWPEWGNPLTSEADYDIIAAYSPYDNVTTRAYPPVLITAGLTDPRVTYWEPAKWAAKLREHQTGSAPIMLKTNMDAGHQGEAGRYDALKETALEYAFALRACGIKG